MIVYEKIVTEDLNIGTGSVAVTNPGGGQMQGSQINIASFAFATVSQAWAPGTIGISVTANTSVAIKGVLPGDFILVSLTTLTGGALALYGIAGVDVVNVYMGNGTGAPQAISAGTLKVSVFKTP